VLSTDRIFNSVIATESGLLLGDIVDKIQLSLQMNSRHNQTKFSSSCQHLFTFLICSIGK